MGGLAIILEKAKKAKAKGGEPTEGPELDMAEDEAEEPDMDEESNGGLEAMKLFESAGTTEEKLKAFKMLMKACEY